MRRLSLFALILVISSGVLVVPTQAQGDLTAEEQTALDTVRAAMLDILGANTWTAKVTQRLDQSISFGDGAETFTLEQHVKSEGVLDFQVMPDNEYANRELHLTQTISVTLEEPGVAPQVTEVGPNDLAMIVVDDRIYLKLDAGPELAGMFPEGWQDITDGAGMFPGMEMFNFEGMLQIGTFTGAEYLDDLLTAVTRVEIADPEVVGERTMRRIRVTFDMAQFLDLVGPETLAQMFNIDETGMDVDAFITALYDDPDTEYSIVFGLDADTSKLVEYAEQTSTDADITAALEEGAVQEGVTVTLTQSVNQNYIFTGIDVPLTITAPDLES